MFKKILAFLISFLIFAIYSYSQQQEERITITTYYPSPYGSYRELETEILHFREDRNGLINFNYPDDVFDRKLVITAGRDLSIDEGASIILYGNNYIGGWGLMDIDRGSIRLVAGSVGDIIFLTGQTATERLRIRANGNVVGNICLRRQYTTTSGTIRCPAGYQLAGVVYSATLPDTGQYLCCPYCNDFNFDGVCD